MKKSNIGFPHPVLCSENNDYIDSSFSLNADEEASVENNVVKVALNYDLKSNGLSMLLNDNKAKVVLYSESSVSSFRQMDSFDKGTNNITLSYDAGKLSRLLRIKAMIIAIADFDGFSLDEHNSELFEAFPFKIHRGDILAISNCFDIDLALIDPLSNRPSIFSIRPSDTATDTIRIDLLEGADKINIWLKRDIHEQYQELEKEPAIRKLLASYFVMPALVEALEFMRTGSENSSDEFESAKERGWFQSITSRLASLDIDLNNEVSMTTVANKLLTDIVHEAMDCLKQIKDNILTGNTTTGE